MTPKTFTAYMLKRQRRLWTVSGHAFGETMGEADHAGRAVGRIEEHIKDVKLARIGQRLPQRVLKFLLRPDHTALSAPDEIADPFVVPVMEVVEGAFEYFTLGRVAAIVQHNDDGCLSIAHGR